MKQSALFAALLIWAFAANATESKTPSKPNKAMLYIQGALLEHSTKANLTSGHQYIVFTGLPTHFDEQSLRVGAKGNFSILSVSKHLVAFDELNKPKEYLQINDSLFWVNQKLEKIKAEQAILVQERDLILANKEIKGQNTSLAAAELKSMADFFRVRLNEIADLKLKKDAENKELSDVQKDLNKRHREWQQKLQKALAEVVVEVQSTQALTQVPFQFMYLVQQASWTPSYAIEAKANSTKLDVRMEANVRQSTGIDWDKVELSLSTSMPLRHSVRPEIHPWVLHFMELRKLSNMAVRSKAEGNMPSMNQSMDMEVMEEAQTMQNFTQVVDNQISTVYAIKMPYSIPGDNESRQVHIQNHQLEAKFNYYGAPKLDAEAFLLANAFDWDALRLLPGEARMFVDGMYAGKSFVNPNTTDDTLRLSLGRDKSIVMQYKQVKEFSKKAIIGNNKTDTRAIEIIVRNTKSVAVDMLVEDQIPLSSNNEIQVELLEKANAQHDSKTGKLMWNLKLNPGESKTLRFVYTVKYPKDKVINL